ncbi:MAG: alpha/beta-hydrolase family protein [Balneolaceae bacterium]|nr:alpha/beta-hydrolase family protein [Balneolaceae bacterium]
MQLDRYFSTTGLLVGTLFFALSMSPTLLPRSEIVQGVISGLALVSGYGVGVLWVWLWSYFELPKPRSKNQAIMQIIAGVIFLLIAVIFLWKASGWQNSVRVLMGLEENATVNPFLIGTIAVAVFLTVLLLGRLFLAIKRKLSKKLEHYIPRRVSYVVGLVTTFVLFWLVANGLLFSLLLQFADSSYQQFDALMEPEYDQPAEPIKTGSIESILSWEEMGREGRRFLSTGPNAEDIREFTSGEVRDPIRVYVGMHASESFDERATLALEELIRVNAFDRSALVIITPTGTGWVDPAAIDPLEYLHRGDIASVAAQYSYLPSPLSLLAEDEYGADMARALFRVVYNYWTELPHDERPKLYLHGLSLGALNSDRSFDLYDIINDPFHGALWVGPPFRKNTWRTLTLERNPDSPAWLPKFRDGSVVRFANQNGGLNDADSEWGTFRIAYLQYASDPVTFFEPSSFSHEPEWMRAPRGPDVSEDLRWFPIVTMLQLAADMSTGTAPRGFGHEYAAEHYFDSWVALTEPQGWSDEELSRLRAYFAEKNYGPS